MSYKIHIPIALFKTIKLRMVIQYLYICNFEIIVQHKSKSVLNPWFLSPPYYYYHYFFSGFEWIFSILDPLTSIPK